MQNYSNTPGQNPAPGQSATDKLIKWAFTAMGAGLVLTFLIYTVLEIL
jgi:hypothetical protein